MQPSQRPGRPFPVRILSRGVCPRAHYLRGQHCTICSAVSPAWTGELAMLTDRGSRWGHAVGRERRVREERRVHGGHPGKSRLLHRCLWQVPMPPPSSPPSPRVRRRRREALLDPLGMLASHNTWCEHITGDPVNMLPQSDVVQSRTTHLQLNK